MAANVEDKKKKGKEKDLNKPNLIDQHMLVVSIVENKKEKEKGFRSTHVRKKLLVSCFYFITQ